MLYAADDLGPVTNCTVADPKETAKIHASQLFACPKMNGTCNLVYNPDAGCAFATSVVYSFTNWSGLSAQEAKAPDEADGGVVGFDMFEYMVRKKRPVLKSFSSGDY